MFEKETCAGPSKDGFSVRVSFLDARIFGLQGFPHRVDAGNGAASLLERRRRKRAALRAGFEKVKINAVLIGGFNDDEIPELAALTEKWPVDVRFIELMPMPGNTEFGPESYIPVSRVLEALPKARLEKEDGVARLYRLPGAQGCIGLISPISQHFCFSCNRIRLTADGKLKPCLHSAEEYSIKGLDEDGMVEQMRRVILAKPRCHDQLSASSRSHTPRNMIFL